MNGRLALAKLRKTPGSNMACPYCHGVQFKEDAWLNGFTHCVNCLSFGILTSHLKEIAMEYDIVNLTPHTVHVHMADGTIREYPPSGIVPRVITEMYQSEPINGIPVVGSVDNPTLVEMPEAPGFPNGRGTAFIVSRMVAEAARNEGHMLLVPHDLVRDGQGRVVGCRGFESVGPTDPCVPEDLEYAKKITELQAYQDTKSSHIQADQLLVELLVELGCTHTATAFQGLEKWYA